MPSFTLYITGAVTDCTLSKAAGSSIRVKLSCGSCREAADKFSVISLTDALVPIPGSRGEVHLLQRCHACREQGNVTLQKLRTEPLSAPSLEAAAGAALCTIECRGCEPVAWQVGDGWTVAALGDGGASWEASFDEEDTFTEFDEVSGVPVTVEALAGVWRKD
jgi:hypothetical protein